MARRGWVRAILRALGEVVLAGSLAGVLFLAVAPVWPAAERMARQGGTAAPSPPTGVLAGTIALATGLVLAGFVRGSREGRR